MERRRIPVLIGLNALAVVVFLAWLGWHFLAGLSRAFGSAGGQSGADTAWVFIVVGLASAACVVASFFVPPAASRTVALAPLLLVVLGQVGIFWLETARKEYLARREEERERAGAAKLREWPRDFVLKKGEDGERSFLIRDSDLKIVVRIDVFGRSQVKASCVGLIDGEHLDVDMEVKYFEPIYRNFLDPEGKNLLERYRIRHKPGLSLFDFPLEKYRR